MCVLHENINKRPEQVNCQTDVVVFMRVCVHVQEWQSAVGENVVEISLVAVIDSDVHVIVFVSLAATKGNFCWYLHRHYSVQL